MSILMVYIHVSESHLQTNRINFVQLSKKLHKKSPIYIKQKDFMAVFYEPPEHNGIIA